MRKEELLNYYFGFNKLKDYITQAVEDASQETGETDLLGADSINGDELANAAKEAAQQAVDAAQEVADSNPIKLTYESEEDKKGDKGGTSSYTGSSTNDPNKEGFTQGATNKGGKVQPSGGNPKIKVELDTTEAQANLDAFVAILYQELRQQLQLLIILLKLEVKYNNLKQKLYS